MDNAGKLAISIATLLIFLGFGAYVFVLGVPPESKDIALQLSGALITWVSAVISYWVGSSSGSSGKDKTIDSLAKDNKP